MPKTPFNWCDYRCERCADAGDCAVYKEEMAARLKNVLQGKDPDSMESSLEAVAESFSKTREILKKMCAERGLSWEEMETAAKNGPSPPDFRIDPS